MHLRNLDPGFRADHLLALNLDLSEVKYPDTARRTAFSIDLMRYADDAPKDVMDFLFVELLRWGRDQGYVAFEFGMAPLAGLEHRMLSFERARAAEPLRAEFEAAGWMFTRLVWMHHEGPRSDSASADGKVCTHRLNFPVPFEIEVDAPGYSARREGPFQFDQPGTTDFQATVCLDPQP